MTSSTQHTPHPLELAAARAATAAHRRAATAGDHLERIRAGTGVSVADVLVGLAAEGAASQRNNEATRRLVTHRIARANQGVLGEDLMASARRLSAITLDESVRGHPLDP